MLSSFSEMGDFLLSVTDTQMLPQAFHATCVSFNIKLRGKDADRVGASA